MFTCKDGEHQNTQQSTVQVLNIFTSHTDQPLIHTDKDIKTYSDGYIYFTIHKRQRRRNKEMKGTSGVSIHPEDV